MKYYGIIYYERIIHNEAHEDQNAGLCRKLISAYLDVKLLQCICRVKHTAYSAGTD